MVTVRLQSPLWQPSIQVERHNPRCRPVNKIDLIRVRVTLLGQIQHLRCELLYYYPVDNHARVRYYLQHCVPEPYLVSSCRRSQSGGRDSGNLFIEVLHFGIGGANWQYTGELVVINDPIRAHETWRDAHSRPEQFWRAKRQDTEAIEGPLLGSCLLKRDCRTQRDREWYGSGRVPQTK